jgi:heat shock protein HslJ
MNRQESAFLQALGATRTWQVTGDTLVLSGEAGPVARFAAQYLR